MAKILVFQSDTMITIPGVGRRAAKYVANGCACSVTGRTTDDPYKPTLGGTIGTMVVSNGKWSGGMNISPSQRNAAVASWWLENCYFQIKGVTKDMTDKEEDTGNAFGWWLSKPEFIKVDGWNRLAWLSIAAKIHDDIIENGVTFRQATGIDSRE